MSTPSIAPRHPVSRDDRIYRESKWLAAFVIPFLITAFYILYLRPADTDQLFAWKLGPSMTARMLGAAYMGGVYFFLRVLLAKRWHTVALGFLPIVAFTSVLSIATILHWDRFNHGHISFITWVVLYFTTPFLVMGTWLRNRQTDPGTPEAQDILLPPVARYALGSLGGITLLISVLLFLWPAGMIGAWPWTLTPLTARVVSAMFALPGVLGLYMAQDGRWSSARSMLESQTLSIALIVLAALLSWQDFNPASPGAWLFVGGMSLLLVAMPALYWSMESRRKSIPAPASPE